MAIAGKVAITLSTENGGAWSADVTYDRLVAVKHNNNLYISRKTVANVEPPNDEFWFLALEGFGGDDIEDIINGTTQVGNAKTLDGHEAEYFALLADLAKYLPLTGGKVSAANIAPVAVENTHSEASLLAYRGKSGLLGYLGFDGANNPAFMSGGTYKSLLHTGNKPTGTYTGNGDATQRKIAIGGIGNMVLLRNNANNDFVLVTGSGYIGKQGNSFVCGTDASWSSSDGNLSTYSTSALLNANGVGYLYYLL